MEDVELLELQAGATRALLKFKAHFARQRGTDKRKSVKSQEQARTRRRREGDFVAGSESLARQLNARIRKDSCQYVPLTKRGRLTWHS